MATPGWYPDPAGRPGAFRYWDGQSWGSDTTDNPYAAPPGSGPDTTGPVAPPNPFDTPTVLPGSTPPSSPTPPTYQSYGGGAGQQYPGQQYPGQQYPGQQYPAQPGWASQPGQPGQPGWGGAQPPVPPGQGKGGAGRTVGLVVGAVVLTLLLGVATFFVVRSLTDDDETTASDDTTSQAETPSSDAPTSEAPTSDAPTAQEPSSEAPTGVDPGTDPGDPFTDDSQPTARQCGGGSPKQGATGIVGGAQTGGGLSMPALDGFTTGDQAAAFSFADGVVAPSRLVTDGWVAVYALGGLNRVNGFESPGQAAAAVLECMTLSSDFYRSLSGAELLDSQATTVDGRPAWVMDAEIRIDDPQIDIDGDVAKVIVVDTGDPERYGLFVSVVPIGRQGLITQQQTQADALSVE